MHNPPCDLHKRVSRHVIQGVLIMRQYDAKHGRTHSGTLGEGVWAAAVFLARWHSGRPIFRYPGQRPTNATFLRRGTKPRSEWDRLTPWAYLPEGIRALIRVWSCEVVPFLAVMWAVTGSWVYATLTILTAATVPVVGSYVTYRAVRHWRHRRKYTQPLNGAVNHVLGMRLPEHAITVPLDFRDQNTRGVVIDLPVDRYIDNPTRNSLKQCVSQRLALPSAEAHLSGEGSRLVLVVRPAPEPPALVKWSELADAMAGCARGEVVLGIDAQGQPFKASLKKGNPHWGFSVNTDRGKSTHAQSIAAQILHQDPRNKVTYIDKKGMSCAPLRGTPGLNLAEDPFDLLGMWAAVESVYDDLIARRQALIADPAATFGIHLLILDELSELADDSADLWRKWRHEEDPRYVKGDSPIAQHLRTILRTGRQFDIHVVVYTQRLDVRSCFGMANLRDLMGLRGLGGYRPNQWRMLIGTTPMPPSPKGKGRWIYSDGEDQTLVQNVYSSDGTDETWEREVLAYASANRFSPAAYTVPTTGGALNPSVAIPGTVTHTTAERLYTAAQVSSDDGQGIVPQNLSAITSAKARAKARGEEWSREATASEWRERMRVDVPVNA